MNEQSPHAISADHVFDGETLHDEMAVIIDGGKIVALMHRSELPRGIKTRALPADVWLAPGFIDLQVNGGGDVLFNDSPTPDGILSIAAAHRRFGTTSLLPTLLTAPTETMRAAIRAVDRAMEVYPGILGIHLEGPFLSPQKPGAHDARLIRKPSSEDNVTLSANRNGVTLVTLAPEEVPAGFIETLVRNGIHVFLGHSAATYSQTRNAIGEGLTGFTHLFNAMPPLLSRHPGPIAAALESPRVAYGLIADGIHVEPAMLRLAMRGVGTPFLVTDAMPPVGGTHSTFKLAGKEIRSDHERCAASDGRLAGALLTMAQAVRNCVAMLEVSLQQALRMASTNPAKAVGVDNRLGRLASGFRADLVALYPEDIRVVETWVAGATQSTNAS
jgi:N-acetylglucosamine-6-phosphate deacetylase